MAAAAEKVSPPQDAPAETPAQIALKTISDFHDFRGFTPFAGSDSRFAVDRCNTYLSSAGCMLSVLAAAFEDSQVLLNGNGNSEFNNRNGSVMAGALEGVSQLIDLASFMLVTGE